MEKEDNPELSESFDLQYGYLELSSGGSRLHNPEKIKIRLSEQNLDPAKFSEHLQAFDWGMPPHAGWGLGLEFSEFHSGFISADIFCFNIIFYYIVYNTL